MDVLCVMNIRLERVIIRCWKLFFFCIVICLFAFAASVHAQQSPLIENSLGAPFRIRDYTFPSFLVLGFAPAPAAPLGRGHSAVEFHYSVTSNFQVSPEVEDYLKQSRGGARRPLDDADVAFILGLPQGQSYYIDGEFSMTEFVVHWGLTERLDLGVGVNYIHYGGGLLDGFIFDVHDAAGVGQQGRDYVSDDYVQVVLGRDGGRDVVLLDRPTDGGLSDPGIFLRYAFPGKDGWNFNFATGIKIPLADENKFLSTGSWDIGFQLVIDKRFTSDALILNLGAVLPGEFKQTNFNPPTLPFINVNWIHRYKDWTNTRFFLQAFLAEHPYRELVDSELSDLEIQLTAGLKWDTSLGIIGLGLTENFLNFDNTPDIALHLTWGMLK